MRAGRRRTEWAVGELGGDENSRLSLVKGGCLDICEVVRQFGEGGWVKRETGD